MATTDALTEQTFTPQRTRRVVEEACRLAGLDANGALVLRHHTCAVYRLVHAPVVVKVARPSQSNVHDIVALTRWASTEGIPTVRLLDDLPQPFEIGGCAVTLWHHLPQTRTITAADLAAPLAALHQAPDPPITLPELDALAAIRWAIGESRLLDNQERDALLAAWERLRQHVPHLDYQAPPRLIHGDPQHRNTLWDDRNHQAVLCDWDSAMIGPVEWDLITIETHSRRFGHPKRYYDAFCDTYGRDIRAWSGYPILRELRELRMIATNARKSQPNTPQATEVHRRIAALAHNDSTTTWNIL